MKPLLITAAICVLSAVAACNGVSKNPPAAAAVSATEKVELGYVHESDAVTVIVHLWASSTGPPSRGEPVLFPVTLQRGVKYPHVVSFIPLKEFARAEVELAKRKLRFIDLRFAGPATVTRGDAVVAKSGRQLFWPKDFQLCDGDVIRIFEVLD